MLKTLRLSSMVMFAAMVCAAHDADTVFIRVSLTTANEVPPVPGVAASGSATIALHLTRTAGAITSAVVELDVSYTLAGATEFVGLNIYGGPAGQTGPVLIGTDLSGSNPVSHSGGAGRIVRSVPITDAALLNSILAQPDQYYANLHTTANPGGVIRGQLSRAELLVLRAVMSPLNEVPPFPNVDASGSANLFVLAVRDGSGQIVSGSVTFDVNYRFADDGTISGLHVHNGPDGVNAGVVIQPSPGVSAAEGLVARGSGNITRASADITSAAALTALRGLFTNPQGHYANLHTTMHPGGIIRGQLQPAGIVTLRTDLLPANEVPAVTGLQADAPATITAHVTRNTIGQITSGTVVFDVNYRFPGRADLTGLHIHNAAAGANGGIVIDSRLGATSSPGGAGNVYRLVNIGPGDTAALAALNGLINNPEDFYVNLRTTANPDGAIRGQLGSAIRTPALINAGGIVSAVNDSAVTAVAPGSLITVYGRDLAKTSSDAGGVEVPLLPIILNATELRVGDRQAGLYYIGPNQINAQVPFETPVGNVPVFVIRSNDYGPPVTLAVRRHAPALFFDNLGAAVLKGAEFARVSASNPAAAGDLLTIFCTGLGAVTPAVPSAGLTPDGPVSLTTEPATVTIGGQPVAVIASSLTPRTAGLYQVVVRLPAGIAPGNQPVVITIGGERSNAALMAVR